MKCSKIIIKFHKFIIKLYLAPLMFYRRYISKDLGTNKCRFSPTCSEYAVQAITKYGIVRGTVKAVWRVLRCNPFCKGGYDPLD